MKKTLLFSLVLYIIGSVPFISEAQHGITNLHHVHAIEYSSFGNHQLTKSNITTSDLRVVNDPPKPVNLKIQQTVTGRVTDSSTGESLPGVNIVVQGTSTGTTTDADGNYELTVPTLQGVLVFSYIGYLTQNINIDGNTVLNIQLQTQEIIGDELVVVGYGVQRRADITGSIASVSERDFNNGIIATPGELLQGKLPGVNVTSASGEPGANQTLTIRGPGTVRGAGPLYVVDGIAVSDASAPGGASFGLGGRSSSGGLAFLNPADIESIDVLKDASATAIYGARGANGVIIITTKQGSASQSQLNYDVNYSISNAAKTIDVLSAEEFASFQNNRGAEGQQFVHGHSTNWQDEILRTGYSKNHSLSYSAGTQNSNYYASVSLLDQEGIVMNSGLERYTGRININQRFLDDRLNIGMNLTASQVRTDYAPIGNNAGVYGDALTNAMTANPTYPTHNPDGSIFLMPDGMINPLMLMDVITDFSEVSRTAGSINASFRIIEGLEYRVNVAVDNSIGSRISQAARHNIPRVDNPEGRLFDAKNEVRNFQTESFLNYIFSAAENHNFNLLAGYSFQKFESQTRSWNIQNFATTEIDAYRNPGIGTSLTIGNNRPSGGAAVNELQSFFGRANYNFMNRYYLTTTVRADGSSRFGADHRYGIFPSFSFAWQLSDEAFINSSAINNLRLRAGWGQTGNQDIPNYITRQLVNVSTGEGSGYQINPGTISPGISFVRAQNESIRWEVSTQTNLGLDFGLFNDAVYGAIDLFHKVSSDILFETTTGVDPISPTSSLWSNYDMEIINRGIEIALAYRNSIGTAFSFDIGGNISFLNNEIKNMPVSLIRTGAISGPGLSGERVGAFLNGKPFGAFWTHEWIGLDSEGMNIFRDVDGDGNITDADHIYAGSALPDMTYGITSNLGYKNFDLSLHFNGVSGNKVYWNDQNAYFSMPRLYGGLNIIKESLNTEEATINSAAASTRFLHNGSYFRLNNATLGYNVNTVNINWLRNLRLYITGQNLFTITDYPGFDPEVDTPRNVGGFSSAGIDGSRYPKARSFVFGVNLTF